MSRPGPHHIGTKGAVDRDVMTYSKATDEWGPSAPTAAGVTTVVQGANVTVDNTDPTHPVISASRGEVLMADGVTSPPVPLETEAGDDWLYQD